MDWKASAAHLLWDSATLTSVPLQTKAAWPGRQAGPGPLLFLAWLLGAGTDDRFFLLPFLIALLSIFICISVSIHALPPFSGHSRVPLAMVVQVNKNCQALKEIKP
jgi:hypothetical protein